jgi:hypothetical protein
LTKGRELNHAGGFFMSDTTSVPVTHDPAMIKGILNALWLVSKSFGSLPDDISFFPDVDSLRKLEIWRNSGRTGFGEDLLSGWHFFHRDDENELHEEVATVLHQQGSRRFTITILLTTQKPGRASRFSNTMAELVLWDEELIRIKLRFTSYPTDRWYIGANPRFPSRVDPRQEYYNKVFKLVRKIFDLFPGRNLPNIIDDYNTLFPTLFDDLNSLNNERMQRELFLILWGSYPNQKRRRRKKN